MDVTDTFVYRIVNVGIRIVVHRTEYSIELNQENGETFRHVTEVIYRTAAGEECIPRDETHDDYLLHVPSHRHLIKEGTI